MRKEKSEKLLSEMGVTINPYLPLIESADEAKIREPKDVARRVIVLCCLAAIAEGVEKNGIIKFLKREQLWEYASPNEVAFFKQKNSPERERIRATWRSEAIWILLWALGHIKDLGMPTAQCSVDKIVEIVPNTDEPTADFIENAKIRPISEILDLSDLMYRAHWATRERGVNQSTEWGDLDNDVVMEWHYAINWLTCYNDAEWDDVTTDT